MSKEFENFLKEQNIPLVMFKMLPKPLRKDIEDKYNELRKEQNNER